jgi:hypothetical protein
MTNETQTTEKVTRIVELKIPLPWLLSVCGGIVWALVSMYFATNALTKTVADLQIDVKAGNNSTTAIVGEIALFKYRMTNAESMIQSLSEEAKRAKK